MSKALYTEWLQVKQAIQKNVNEDLALQKTAQGYIGIKPQSEAVEKVGRVYGKYCWIFNKICDFYEQSPQVQRRVFLRKIIDALTCRILELKETLQNVEWLEYTHPDNALISMIMVPQDIEIMCPFFYSFEAREAEMQFIIDEIMSGNRLGDPKPTPSELERREQERIEEEERLKEAHEAEIRRKIALGEEILESTNASVIYSPEELEKMRLEQEFLTNILTIQRMERYRVNTRARTKKANDDLDLYLELSGEGKPKVSQEILNRATNFIQLLYRKYIQLKREKHRMDRLKIKLDMAVPSWQPVSQKVQYEKVKELRRNYRIKYFRDWMERQVKEKDRIFLLKKDSIMEDISTEVRAWFQEWYDSLELFDSYPWPQEGGSILVTRGETMFVEEYEEWRKEEEKRVKAAKENPKSKQQIKQEKAEAKQAAKLAAEEAKAREAKRVEAYLKNRLNPKTDPGVLIDIGEHVDEVQLNWADYVTQWTALDEADPPENVYKGFITDLIKEEEYYNAKLELRPIVDDMMRMELKLLNAALKKDLANKGIKTMPLVEKRPKPPKPKKPKKDKLVPEQVFQNLVDNGIVRQYPKMKIDEFFGDGNYAAADARSVLWTPMFPPPSYGDVRELIRVRCLLPLGSECPNVKRSHLFVGPKYSGKKTLAYAIATETNAVLIDLSPQNLLDKYVGAKNTKKLITYVQKISKLMQPTIILVSDVDKVFYKKVPKDEKYLNPTRLGGQLFSKIVKPLTSTDKILVIGTASEPWLSKTKKLLKCFHTMTLIPRTDYGSIYLVLYNMLMKYHGVDREFNVHSLAQALRGYDFKSIINAVNKLMTVDRIRKLYHTPLKPVEILEVIMADEDAVFTDTTVYNETYNKWFDTTPWGQKFQQYMMIVKTQYEMYLKEKGDGNKKKK